jgi:DNA-directed RNA polymerase subunit RPC12/RpoP
MDIKEYKCPNCGGTVKFDSATQNMKCPYCEAEFEIKALADYQKEAESRAVDSYNWKAVSQETWKESDLVDLSTGSCPSCGAELIGDKNTIAMVCPCCGNAQIVQKHIQGMLKPEYCIPFRLEKKSAVEALKKFCDKKQLLPNFFSKENRVENIQGMYAPFWLFDAKALARVRYKATRVKAWSDASYNYTKTDFYSVIRDGSLNFEKIPVDGSEKMDDAYMDAIEPFNYTQIEGFQSEYLAGFSAEKYDVDVEASKGRANARIKSTVETEFARSVSGYSSVAMESSTVNIESGNVSYALFPVWILNTKYNKENYKFIMNGQTGRFVGRLPVDKGKAARFTLMFTAIFGVAFTAIIQLLRVFL